MNTTLEHRIRLFAGADFEPEPEPIAYPVLMLVFALGLSWAALVGAAYCLVRAVEAVWG